MTGTGPITSHPATNCGLKTNEVSINIKEEETSISFEHKSLDDKRHSCQQVNGFKSSMGNKLKPEIATGSLGSRSTINTEDMGPESFESDNQEQKLCRDASTREADPTGLVFQRGKVCYGIYLPSLSGRLQDPKLEDAYQKYSYRQRQKSLVLVNLSDLLLKLLVLAKLFCLVKTTDNHGSKEPSQCYFSELNNRWTYVGFLTFAMILNLVFGCVSWWRCYANNYLHWGALTTWFLLFFQVREIFGIPSILTWLFLGLSTLLSRGSSNQVANVR